MQDQKTEPSKADAEAKADKATATGGGEKPRRKEPSERDAKKRRDEPEPKGGLVCEVK